MLRTAFDTIPAMVAYWDSSGHCVHANRAYERWFGVSPENLIGKHISELLGPLYQLNLPYIEGALRGEPQEFERTIPDPKGGPPRHSLANYIPDVVDGVVRGFFVLVSDVSEIKRAQLALHESEERFRLTIDEAPIGMALVAVDGRFLRVNRALCDILGYSSEELTGLTFQAITHPDDLDADLALARLLEEGKIPRYQLGKRYIRKDGVVVDIMLSGSALRRADGSLIHYIAQIEDITEQKRVESEQRFLARVGPVLAHSLDYEETLRRIADLAVEEIADVCIVESVEDDDEVRRIKVASRDPAKAWACDVLANMPLDRSRPHLMQAVLQTRRPHVLEHPSVEAIAALAQGDAHAHALRAIQIDSMIAVPLIAGDTMLGAIALVSSSPARVLDLQLAEELAYRAALSIRSARLYSAAQRATRVRDDVLGVVAHDLRNPLNSILLHATTIRERGHDAARRAKSAAAIERSAHRMNRLIQDLLDVARVESGRLSIVAEPISVNQLLVDAIDAQRPLAESFGIELRLEAAASMPHVLADRDRLNQVFENLIGNALKFTPAGGTIALGAEIRDREILFHVIDSGCGISAEHLPHLFDRFWQAQRGNRHGAGLGLPIVKGIVEAHGGRIWVDSAPEEGTSFHFTIPLAHLGVGDEPSALAARN